MTTPHKHQATINAWASGAQIQWRINDRDIWEDTEQPVWYLNHQYRVKNPHQDLVDAHEAGDLIEVDHGAYWSVVFEPEWRPGSIYRISPRSDELKPMIEAHKAGKQIQRKNGSGWVDTAPTWSSMFEYRIKHPNQDVIDAWHKGEAVQFRSGGEWFGLTPKSFQGDTDDWPLTVEYRLAPFADLKKAFSEGKLIELEIEPDGYWRATLEPAWNERHNYRISPRSAELKALIEAHKAGSEIEMRVGTADWGRCGIPVWSSHCEYRIKDKFADLKNAFSEGKLIESFNTSLNQFCVNLRPLWDEGVEYRLCPRQDELKPVIEAHLKGKQIEFNQRSRPGWCECVVSPKWQASHDYRVKTRWQKELDAWLAGKKIECRRTDRADTWDEQITADLDYYLLDPPADLEFRIFDEYRDLKEAEARGEVIELRLRHDGLWYAQTSPCHFSEPIENYRISPRSAEMRPIIDAYKAGKTIQGLSNTWLDLGVPMFDSKTAYRVKPEALKSRRYIYNRAGKTKVGICDPSNHHQVPAGTFVRWIDDDWVETEV